MSRTFSLATLLLTVTAIALFCGLAVNFPLPVIIGAAALTMCSAALFAVTLIRISHYPLPLFFATLFGTTLGFFLVPLVCWFASRAFGIRWNPTLERFSIYLAPLGPPIGVLLIGGACLCLELCFRRRDTGIKSAI